uniref:TFIID subunit TAF5 NTD2 domain-containing protein n=1 Tax=Timema cristinae TaxID=61476 RepID=A0A7R9H8G0_TIMCR|nr:unnamed protein product [Timema cristinae]
MQDDSCRLVTTCPAQLYRCICKGGRRHCSDKSVVVTIMLSCRHRVQQGHKITWNLTTTDIDAGTDTDIIGTSLEFEPKKESMSSELSSLTLEQKIVSSVVEKEASRSNSFLYSSCNFDPTQVDLQFSSYKLRLKAWICGELNDEVWHCELAALLCPMFCHLYLEMLRVVPRHEVTKFYKKHEGMFVGREEEMRELARELAEVSSLEELDSKPLTRNFRMSQFHSVISPAAMNALQKYLAKDNNVILLQLLHTWFNFEIMLHHYILEQEEEPLLEEKLDEKVSLFVSFQHTRLQ